jgi:hypothetical protein
MPASLPAGRKASAVPSAAERLVLPMGTAQVPGWLCLSVQAALVLPLRLPLQLASIQS